MNALQRRAELQAALDTACRQYDQATQRRQQSVIEVGRARKGLAAMQQLRASGGAKDKDVDKAHKRLAAAEEAVADNLNRADSALDARKAIELQLDELIGQHFAEFAEEAEALTQAAVAAVLALEKPYDRARESWEAAEAAWAPLARNARVEGVQPFPAANSFADLRSGAVVARPRSILVASAAEEADGIE